MSRKNKISAAGEAPGPGELPWLPYAAIAAAVALVYGRALWFGATYLFDNVLLEKQALLANWRNLPAFFAGAALGAGDGGPQYRPLLDASYLFDALRGGGLFDYHLTNLALHFAACALLFRALARLAYGRGTALFCALAYALHPALAQAVAWVPGRNDLLLAVFALGSFEAFLAWLESRGRAALAAHLLLLACALFTRPEGALLYLPLVYFFAALKAPREKPGPSFALWAGWLGAGLLRAWAGGRAPSAEAEPLAALPVFLKGALAALGKAVLPVKPGLLQVPADLPWAWGLAAAALCAYAMAKARNRRPAHMVFGLLWFAVFALPAAGELRPTGAGLGEYRLYAALPGLLLFLAELAPAAWLFLAGRRAAYAGGAALLLLGARTFTFSAALDGKNAFWAKAVETSPNSAFNRRNYGAALYLDGDRAGAEAQFRRAAELNPYEKGVHGNLGLVCMETGRYDEAREEYLRETALDPANANVWLNLGLLYYSRGLVTEAEGAWEQALELDPDFEKVYLNLAVLNYRKGDVVKAKYYAGQMRLRGYAVPESLAEQLAAAEKKPG